jgi:hypothetical protein
VPPLPDVAKVIKVALTFSLDEDLGARCQFFKRYSGTAPSASQLTTFAGDINGLFDTEDMKSLLSASYALEDVECTDLSSSTAAFGHDDTGVTGTRGGDIVPASAALVVSHRISRRYRGGHPRTYFPFGVQADMQDAQTWTDAFVTEADGVVDSFFGAINAAGWASAGGIDSVNVSYYEGFSVFITPSGRAKNISTPRAVPLVDAITAHSPRHGIGSQRGRLLHLA